MNLQLKNWDNFCNYHTGDWKGTRKRYSPDSKIIETWDVITHLHVNQDQSEITHQDELFYSDGSNEVKNYGIYKKPQTSALFLDSTFCWGSKIVNPDSIFIFEFGFRHKDKRVLCYFRYDETGNLEYSSTGIEYLNNKDTEENKNNYPELKKADPTWIGSLQKMTTEKVIYEPIKTDWKSIKELNKDYLIQDLGDNIIATFPKIIAQNQSFLIGVDWQINDQLLKRGIVYYEASELSYFTVQTFTPVN
ncbi:MAG: DUF3598 family protein [Crocosphaera sp.]